MKENIHKIIPENIEHRGNDNNVASKFQLEMELIRNMNKEKPIYSFDKKKSEST